MIPVVSLSDDSRIIELENNAVLVTQKSRVVSDPIPISFRFSMVCGNPLKVDIKLL